MTITSNGEIYIFTGACLLSRRLITDGNTGEPITRADIAGASYSVYKVTTAANGAEARTLVATQQLTPADVITADVQTDADGNQYNFNYCVEGAFTQPSTVYLVEYRLITAAGHTLIIAAKGRTVD